MASFFVPKQPFDEFNITVDFATYRLASSESITNTVVTAIKISDGSDVTSEVIDADDQSAGIVSVSVKAGEDGERYNIKIQVTTDAGNKYEADVVMDIEDTPT